MVNNSLCVRWICNRDRPNVITLRRLRAYPEWGPTLTRSVPGQETNYAIWKWRQEVIDSLLSRKSPFVSNAFQNISIPYLILYRSRPILMDKNK